MSPLASYIDHTQLKAICTESDIVKLCAEARQYQFAAVCIPPCYVGTAKEELKESGVKVCSVAAFPLGYNPTWVKMAECSYLLDNGADEVDVVVNVSWIKSGKWSQVREELMALHQIIVEKKAVFKLIFETAYLNREEILQLADLCLECGVDYLKTSTGFAPKGAELDTVVAIKEKIGDKAKIKASGGISDLPTALAFIEAGADRIGTSSGVKLVTENASDR